MVNLNPSADADSSQASEQIGQVVHGTSQVACATRTSWGSEITESDHRSRKLSRVEGRSAAEDAGATSYPLARFDLFDFAAFFLLRSAATAISPWRFILDFFGPFSLRSRATSLLTLHRTSSLVVFRATIFTLRLQPGPSCSFVPDPKRVNPLSHAQPRHRSTLLRLTQGAGESGLKLRVGGGAWGLRFESRAVCPHDPERGQVAARMLRHEVVSRFGRRRAATCGGGRPSRPAMRGSAAPDQFTANSRCATRPSQPSAGRCPPVSRSTAPIDG